MRRLSDLSKCAHLLGELSNICVYVAPVQETHFICAEDCRMVKGEFVVFSAVGSRCRAGISQQVGRSFDAIVNLVFADDGPAGCG